MRRSLRILFGFVVVIARRTITSICITADMQRLHGVLAGIALDDRITEDELRQLQSWLEEHQGLKTCWPYDEIESLIVGVLKDGRIDPVEHRLLIAFFTEFVRYGE